MFQQLDSHYSNLHTDLSRHFSPVESIISVIDRDSIAVFHLQPFASVIFPTRTVDKFTLIQATQSIVRPVAKQTLRSYGDSFGQDSTEIISLLTVGCIVFSKFCVSGLHQVVHR